MPFPERRYSNLVHADLPIGTRVQIKNPCVDFHFFATEGDASFGTVIDNTGGYLGVKVALDVTYRVQHGLGAEFDMTQFNFNPTDLIAIAYNQTQDVYEDQDFETD